MGLGGDLLGGLGKWDLRGLKNNILALLIQTSPCELDGSSCVGVDELVVGVHPRQIIYSIE